MNPPRVVIGTLTAGLALLALTAMHALPMSATHSDAAAAEAPAAAAVLHDMHAGHVDGMAMPGDLDAVDAAVSSHSIAPGTLPAAAAATRSTDGVPPHGHSLLHLCIAVLVVALSLALAAGVRRRPLTSSPLTFIAPVRAALTRDNNPPSLAGLCLLRC